ncbi:hypothetical protein TVAG_222720 [Trichomonas vaginalis G3]|uniref:Uncharacterized protein n=1 Tax=Trichomonas vaginalis (strain ATCC PRA-98 / G3) TaxID=412133 RepID=A2G9Q0_TRIV3|nr:hypothetical protein TVAGG3_0250330 [Trichomonas vaginalis G3]EAX86118.1 hypothetical protein TVAG_222720 [Trichomonas vaginalis G3]KAI5553956.1 hypothetical protein TVAGG3_0250330 [Trichomonas vaginalis G3]|eukprot:XP_001299048.1 hypothetical protein [Trichomonas vaginalis G3]
MESPSHYFCLFLSVEGSNEDSLKQFYENSIVQYPSFKFNFSKIQEFHNSASKIKSIQTFPAIAAHKMKSKSKKQQTQAKSIQWTVNNPQKTPQTDTKSKLNSSQEKDELKKLFPDWLNDETVTILVDLIFNAKKGSPNHHSFYSPTLDFAFHLFCQSPKTYKTLRTELSFPAKSTLYNHFGFLIDYAEVCLLDTDGIEDLLNIIKNTKYFIYKDENDNEQEIIPIYTLGINAIITTQYSDSTDSGLFVFVLMPLNYHGPNIIIHLIEHANGCSKKFWMKSKKLYLFYAKSSNCLLL